MQENEIRQVETIIEAALAQIRDQYISGALEDLLQAVEMEPENVRIINLIASCYFILGEFKRAVACWEMVIRIDEGNHDATRRLEAYNSPAFQFWLKRYHEALARMESRNYQMAVTLLRQLMEENDGFVSLYELLGLCYLALSEQEKAKKVWKKGLELDRGNESLLAYLVSRKETKVIAREQIIASQKEAAAVEEKVPNRRQRRVRVIAGVICLALLVPAGYQITSQLNDLKKPTIERKMMKYDQGSEKEKGARSVMAPTSKTKGLSGKVSPQENEKTQAGSDKTDIDRALEESYYNQGLAAYLKGDWQQASTSLGEVVAMQSGDYLNREALYYLARTKYVSKEFSQARDYYLKYLKEFPDSNYYDDSLYYLGCIYHQSGQDEEARKVFKELQEYEPTSGYLSTTLFKSIMNK